MQKIICLLIITLSVSGCTYRNIENYNTLEQQDNKILTASVGSTIFRMNRSADLPNIYGKADIYGGKVDKGFAELKLKAIKDDGKIILQITDLNKSTTETTMDRYLHSNVNISANNTINMEEAPRPDTTVFEFDPKKEKSLTIGIITVTFIEVSSYNIKYQLKKEK